MPVIVRLADYLQPLTTGPLATTEYGRIGAYDLAAFLARWPAVHTRALASLGPARIHPTAVTQRRSFLSFPTGVFS